MAQDQVDSAPPDIVRSAEPVESQPEHILNVKLKLPHEPFESTIQIATTEQVQDIRQTIAEQPYGLQYSCFHLEHNGQRMNDFVDLSEIPGIGPESVLTLVEDPYNEKEARIHLIRVRELIGVASDKPDSAYGISYGAALHDIVAGPLTGATSEDGSDPDINELANYQFAAAGDLQSIVPHHVTAPKTVKSISLSPWNPPPPYLRNKGHLLYLVVVNLEGEQYHITSHVSGFYLNRSSHNKFDPSPKPGPKTSSAHSLLTLLHHIDPKFTTAFTQLSDFNTQRDLLQFYPIAHAAPASPWLVSPESKSLQDHRADVSRAQETYLIGGSDNVDNLRDWNEEFQVAKELSKENEAEKVFREKLTTKLYAEFTDAAVKGAVLLSRGELAPLNPTEERDAQIFVYNNVFFSFGVDGVGTFAATGGDDAARYATGKDVCGVRVVNQLDIPDLSTAATIIVDYLGRRIVAQSIVPGIFKQKEPHDSIDYGGVEGKDIIATKPMFVEPFAALAKATYVKRHPVWDAENKRHDLETSVETKGLLGTDGRKYALDLYKLQPLDVDWLEKHWGETEEERTGESRKDYPHRMSTLRPELVESYRLLKLHDFIDNRLAEEEKSKKEGEKERPEANGHSEDVEMKDAEVKEANGEDDAKKFSFTLNPDVYSGQVPQTEEEKEEMAQDEKAVREVCTYLTDRVIPKLVEYLKDSDSSFPLDGPSLTTLLHKRGINMRYLGVIANLANQDNDRLKALRRLAIQEMVSRSIKHVAIKYFRDVPTTLASACMSHILNCILGTRCNPDPVSEVDETLRAVYGISELAFEGLTPEVIRKEVIEECRRRFRYSLEGDLVEPDREIHMLREISLKLGLQLVVRDFQFDGVTPMADESQASNGTSGRKKKRSKESSPPGGDQHSRIQVKQTFHPDDIANFAPVIKDSCPKSAMAEETFEAGRISLAQGQREIGIDLLMQSLHIHEQVYSVIHPEVARLYVALSNIYYSMEDRATAIELAKKAVVIAERTIGLDSCETVQAYINLALFEHSTGHSALALRYLVHAIELQKIVWGADHPDYVNVINNGAVMLQTLRRYSESREWFDACAALSTEPSVNRASILFQLSQALTLEKNIHGAVNRMREAASMFRNLLGPEDRNTKEAENWLEQLTTNAVNMAKRQKDLASGRMKRVHFVNSNGSIGLPGETPPVPKTNGIAGGTNGSNTVDDRNIDDLIKFIEGKDAKIAAASTKSKRGIPKRRGGAKSGSK